MRAQEVIKILNLQPHPEGGYFAETFRSGIQHSSVRIRNLATSIYFLLEKGKVSKFHQLTSDEIWYFHSGSPVNIYQFEPGGEFSNIILGMDLDNHQLPQCVIKAGTIFGADVINDGYTLMGCMVAPGFDFEDFRMVGKEELLRLYPEKRELIHRLT